jgi:hypothetical protein
MTEQENPFVLDADVMSIDSEPQTFSVPKPPRPAGKPEQNEVKSDNQADQVSSLVRGILRRIRKPHS